MLEPVEERQDEPRRPVRTRASAVGETVRLHRDEQEVDGLLQPLRGLELRGALAVVSHERQAFGGNHRRGLRPRDADDALAGERQPDAERTPDRPGPEHRDAHSGRVADRG